MNQQTFKQWKKANPNGTVEEWLDLHTDKRKVTVKHNYRNSHWKINPHKHAKEGE